MNYSEINIKEEEEEENIDTILSNFWLNLNNAKLNNDDLDDILIQLYDIRDQIIIYFKAAAFKRNVEELKIYQNKLLKIKWYTDITTGYIINNLSSHQRNHLNFHQSKKKNIQTAILFSVNACYSNDSLEQRFYSKSKEEFDDNTFVQQVFNEKQMNTTITRIQITDPIPNPWLRDLVAVHPVKRQQHDDNNNNNQQQ